LQKKRFGKGRALQLKADRESLAGKTTGQSEGTNSRQIGSHGKGIEKVHRQGIL
jgi:hypothetical protein